MKARNPLGRTVAAIVVGVLIGGGLMTVTPAGAEVSQAVATNWKKIWKKKIKPQADKRYYTKAASDVKYAAAGSSYSKAEVDAALGGYVTKAQADAAYQLKGNYAIAGSSYSKAESDARYAPVQPLYRGSLMFGGDPTAASQTFYGSISFGATFSAAPTSHYIKVGDLIPAGCSGSASSPNAAPGHLCIFETEGAFAPGVRGVCSASGPSCGGNTDKFGAGVFVKSTVASPVEILATWAARPTAVVNPAFVPLKANAVNEGAVGGTPASAR